MSRDKQNIKTTDWLIRGIPEEQLKREKQEALLSAYLELCNVYDEETKRIDFDATAEKMVAEGYVKASDVAEEIFAEIESTLNREYTDLDQRRKHIKDHDALDGIDGELCGLDFAMSLIDELKKKYTEGER